MVSKNSKKTTKKPSKERHTPKDISSQKRSGHVPSSVLVYSINRTVLKCKRQLAKIFSKLVALGTPKRRCYKGYRSLESELPCDKEDHNKYKIDGLCKILFINALLPPLISSTRKTVVLDLDETLVHSSTDPPPPSFDFIVRPRINGDFMNFYVLKRPGLCSFLAALSSRYEVVVFTAGLKEYASLVLDEIDPKGTISHRLFRDSCMEVEGKFVKDLLQLGRDLSRVLIVDDNPYCCSHQPENAILVKPFTGDVNDDELVKLTEFFTLSYSFDDVRDAIRQYRA